MMQTFSKFDIQVNHLGNKKKKKKKETVLIEMQNSAQQNCKSESERPNNFIV